MVCFVTRPFHFNTIACACASVTYPHYRITSQPASQPVSQSVTLRLYVRTTSPPSSSFLVIYIQSSSRQSYHFFFLSNISLAFHPSPHGFCFVSSRLVVPLFQEIISRFSSVFYRISPPPQNFTFTSYENIPRLFNSVISHRLSSCLLTDATHIVNIHPLTLCMERPISKHYLTFVSISLTNHTNKKKDLLVYTLLYSRPHL